MAVLDEPTIRELASIRGQRAPITSCYLDVDGRRVQRYPDLEQEVDLLLRQARDRANGDPSVRLDLQNIEQYVRSGIDRSRTRGVAIFACSDEDLWRVIELPVPVTPQVAFNPSPAVGQLEAVIQRDEPVGVLAVDRQRARIYVYALGDLLEQDEIFDAPPRETEGRGERDRSGDRPEQTEEALQHHLRRAAQMAFEMWQRHDFAHLAIAAREPLANEMRSALHPYLADRLAGRLDLPVSAHGDEIRAAALEIEEDVEHARQSALVDKLREAVATNRRGVAGLPDVLRALGENRVDRLLVSQGFSAPGWRCDECRMHSTLGRRCKRCESPMVELDDVVEEAVQDALSQSCVVEVCAGNADLDVLGRIGALLRY